jgi:DNA topoisomerase I
LKIERKETTPPGRYTEASLVKKMEELGIGRPSTYASIVETLKGRDYTEAEKKTLKPTDKGILVVQMLDKYFDTIINTTYTAQMEDKLDQIAEGKLEKLTQLKEFYDSFEPLVLKAHREVNKDKEKPQMTDKLCAKCAAPMVIRSSKFGQFYACSKFPKCKHTEKMEGAVQANATPTVAPVSTGKTCPVCNEGQLVKRIAKTGKSAGSSFYACNKFPKCKTTYNEEQYVAQFGAAPSFSDVSTDTE